MQAKRATTELGMMGAWYGLTGVVALARAARPDFGVLGIVLAAGAVVAAISVIAMAVLRLRDIEGLPETAMRASWRSVAARVSLSALLPIATVVLLSATSAGLAWVLGLVYVVLGAAICATALLAGHVEHLCGARVWRANDRFYFAR